MTENFKQTEFACKCGCGYQSISPHLVQRLQVLRDIVRQPLVVNSGCRCERHNTNIGGSQNSLHVTGLAADITIADKGLLGDMARLLSDWSGGMKYYAGRFIHLDIGARRRW